MTTGLLVAVLVLAAAAVVFAVVAPARTASAIRGMLSDRLEAIERAQERIERAVRDEIASSRGEASRESAQLREEVRTTLKQTGDSMDQRLDRFAAQLTELSSSVGNRLDQFQKATDERLTGSQLSVVARLEQASAAQADSSLALRTELTNTLKGFGDSLDRRLGELTESNQKKLQELRAELANASALQRTEVATALKHLSETLMEQVTGIASLLKKEMEAFSGTMSRLTEANEKRLGELRTAVDEKLKSIQDDNAKRLEAMRQTVDEKLQGTLEKRLGESFKFVGDRLEAVQAGLGEMRTLASGVGDLKKVLSNVRVRGTWGEIQLGNLLSQMLAPEQFVANVTTKPHTSERVEFAIKLPGAQDSEEVLLPIDSKFPMEDYQRLVDASERGDAEAVEQCASQLEQRIKLSAEDIRSKYLNPPYTTDFGIMFLPTEGLYAEVIRRSGLAEVLQRDYRVIVAGPTTLAALLNSFQMGFRTLAIQKRSSEVWQILAAVKAEFGKFGEVIDAVDKKLGEAQKKLGTVGTRSRAIVRKLRDVEELPASDAQALLMKGEAAMALEAADSDESEEAS